MIRRDQWKLLAGNCLYCNCKLKEDQSVMLDFGHSIRFYNCITCNKYILFEIKPVNDRIEFNYKVLSKEEYNTVRRRMNGQ